MSKAHRRFKIAFQVMRLRWKKTGSSLSAHPETPLAEMLLDNAWDSYSMREAFKFEDGWVNRERFAKWKELRAERLNEEKVA